LFSAITALAGDSGVESPGCPFWSTRCQAAPTTGSRARSTKEEMTSLAKASSQPSGRQVGTIVGYAIDLTRLYNGLRAAAGSFAISGPIMLA
jgi:hypothetical protein